MNLRSIDVWTGAHTFGQAHCNNFINRLYNFNYTGNPDPTLNTTYLEALREICSVGLDNLADMDLTTPKQFDNKYYSNLQYQNGLLQSDQELFSTSDADTVALVNRFSTDQSVFFDNFVVSMLKMGSTSVLTEDEGEIRLQCNFVNGDSSGLVGVASKAPKLKLAAKSK